MGIWKGRQHDPQVVLPSLYGRNYIGEKWSGKLEIYEYWKKIIKYDRK